MITLLFASRCVRDSLSTFPLFPLLDHSSYAFFPMFHFLKRLSVSRCMPLVFLTLPFCFPRLWIRGLAKGQYSSLLHLPLLETSLYLPDIFCTISLPSNTFAIGPRKPRTLPRDFLSCLALRSEERSGERQDWSRACLQISPSLRRSCFT